MKRVAEIKPARTWNAGAAVDFIVLDAQDRHRRRVVFVGEQGATYLLDLPRPAQLHDGDGLLLEDGSLVRVTGKAEPLVEICADISERTGAHRLASRQPAHRSADRRRQAAHPPRSRFGRDVARLGCAADRARCAVRSRARRLRPSRARPWLVCGHRQTVRPRASGEPERLERESWILACVRNERGGGGFGRALTA